jgi:hypothetical protein
MAKALALLLAHLLLTALPGVAAALLAARRGERRLPVLLALGLAATGAAAMLAFWAFYAKPVVGESFSFLLAFGAALLSGWLLWEGRIEGTLLRGLAVPLGLWALGTVFLVFLGFLHGVTDGPVSLSALRFSHQLPSDNDLPNFFAGWFYEHGHAGRPPIYPPHWNASERPPLQIGYVLSQRPFGNDVHGLNYQLLGVALQQLWIVGLWALLLAAGIGRRTRALVAFAVLLSGVAIVNGFYVWPKMLPTAMLLGAAALVLTPMWEEVRRSLWGAALVAALLGLALLSHGTAAFGAIALALVAAWRGLPGWRWLGVGALVGLALLAPWSAYQKYGDPPGNRLVRWMLGGDTSYGKQGSLSAIADGYSAAGVGGTLDNKAENFAAMVGISGLPQEAESAFNGLEEGDLATVVGELRGIAFYHLLPSLGLFLLGPLAMLAARRRGRLRATEWSFALTSFAVVLVGAVVWGLLLFGNDESRTVLHQGSYLLPLLGLVGAVAGLRATFPRFALWFVPIAALLGLALYVPALEPSPGTSYSFLAALLVAAGLGGYALLAWRGDGAAEPANTLAP